MLTLPLGAAEPAGAVLLHAADHVARRLAVTETDEYLVENDVIQDRHAARRPKQLGEEARVRAAALDELGDTAATEGANRSVDGEAARTARELRRPVDGIPAARVVLMDEVRRRHRHRRAMGIRMSTERDPGVVRCVEPLVTVGRPRVRPLDAVHQMPQLLGSRGPEAESPVDVEPGTCPFYGVCDGVEIVAGTGVHLPDLPAHDGGRSVELGQLRHDQPSLVVGRDDGQRGRADSEQSERPVDRDVALLADDDADWRRTYETV